MDNKSYKEIIIQRAVTLSKKTIHLIDKFPKKQSSSIISAQLLRAVTSVPANIIEAQAGSSRKDFINYINHALKSANESIYWFDLINEIDTTLKIEADSLKNETSEIARILGSTINKLRKKL